MPTAAEDGRNFVKLLKKRQEQGIIFEANPEEQDSVYDWFEINTEKVQETLHRDTLWSEEGIHRRGKDFEKIREANLGSAMTATQHKSIDLTLKSYQVGSRLDSTVRGYIDDLSDVTGGKHFQYRYLELGIPAGKATRAQIENLLDLQDYAQTKDVTLVIVEVP